MSAIVIKGARTGNLKNIDATIPKQQLVVLTGVSGCGKSTLAIDTLFQECQRRYLEAMGMQGIQKPKLDSLSARFAGYFDHAPVIVRIIRVLH